jgi:hypothetical protein
VEPERLGNNRHRLRVTIDRHRRSQQASRRHRHHHRRPVDKAMVASSRHLQANSQHSRRFRGVNAGVLSMLNVWAALVLKRGFLALFAQARQPVPPKETM